MANSQTYLEGFSPDGTQVTTLAEIQGAGLRLPTPSTDYINIRSPGKIERLFSTTGNSNVLYTQNKPQDLYLKGPLASQMFVYTSIEQGQRDKTNNFRNPSSQIGAALIDGRRVTRFLSSNRGINFILNQVFLQGFQPFDETKVYNPASPIVAALRAASFGVVDYPTRHIDTSNIVGGLLGGSGLGSIVRTATRFLGGSGRNVPAPPRSSVASEASRGLGLSTFTSLLGGADRSDLVVSPLARPDVRDLLRGQTATNAYNAYRYSKLVSSGGGNFFTKLLGAAGKFLQNNTIVGGIVPPKQPWAANYRADEQTYDLYLNAGKLFDDTNVTPTKSGGILSGLKKVLGIGVSKKFTGLRANQRFYHGSINPSSMIRNDFYIKTYGQENQQDSIGVVTFEGKIQSEQVEAIANSDYRKFATDRNNREIISNGKIATQLKYTDLVGADRNNGTLTEKSDQLLNYKVLIENSKLLPDTFSDETKIPTQIILNNLEKVLDNIAGNDANDLYNTGFTSKKNAKPLQFAKYDSPNEIGMNYLKDVKTKYTDKFTRSPDNLNFPTRLGKNTTKDRFIQPTNNVDYVNSLGVLDTDEFNKLYGNESQYGSFGPDIVKFFFYDMVNDRYIPFSATVKGITDTNLAEYEPIEYLGRPDKLYYYKGFTREVNFNFTVNAHSIKELMPMWNRINYLVGLTKPSNYTQMAAGGFMVPPMVQLTLGDFYKNHFVVIKSCNVTIPDDASWETIPENMTSPNEMWSWGSNRAYRWDSSKNLLSSRGDKASSIGKFAQFPRTADINVQMSILEKDRPKTGRGAWGDSPVPIINKNILNQLVATNKITAADVTDDLIGKDYYGTSNDQGSTAIFLDTTNDFSSNIRTDNDTAIATAVSSLIPTTATTP